jgi:hypothetical protein
MWITGMQRSSAAISDSAPKPAIRSVMQIALPMPMAAKHRPVVNYAV